ncbi:MAG: RdgB/HAM1 family non-canonical purine NTP pyrophosphatase [Oscillospiraceae bacterium]
MKLIIASNNKGKIREFRQLLSPLGYDVVSQSEAGVNIEVEETGTTFAENSALKARAIRKIKSDCAVLADDSGLVVDAVNGEPGVYSARYGGLSTDAERTALLLEKMRNVPDDKRTARFICCIHFIKANGEEFSVEGKCEGKIGYESVGENGFGYDPVFMYGDKSFAQVSPDVKNSVSHRANALKALIEQLKK